MRDGARLTTPTQRARCRERLLVEQVGDSAHELCAVRGREHDKRDGGQDNDGGDANRQAAAKPRARHHGHERERHQVDPLPSLPRATAPTRSKVEGQPVPTRQPG
jgi:hypothetical protein